MVNEQIEDVGRERLELTGDLQIDPYLENHRRDRGYLLDKIGMNRIYSSFSKFVGLLGAVSVVGGATRYFLENPDTSGDIGLMIGGSILAAVGFGAKRLLGKKLRQYKMELYDTEVFVLSKKFSDRGVNRYGR